MSRKNFFYFWKKFMRKNAIKIAGGVKFSKKIPQNMGFFDQKVWDFWHWGGDKIVGFSASRGGFSPFNFWPHWASAAVLIYQFSSLFLFDWIWKCSKAEIKRTYIYNPIELTFLKVEKLYKLHLRKFYFTNLLLCTVPIAFLFDFLFVHFQSA